MESITVVEGEPSPVELIAYCNVPGHEFVVHGTRTGRVPADLLDAVDSELQLGFFGRIES